MPIYSLHDSIGSPVRIRPEDGDMFKVSPAGYDFEATKPLYSIRLEDGSRVSKVGIFQGVRMDPTHLTRNFKWNGQKGEFPDFKMMSNALVVRDNFRAVVERLEPGLHQFEPVNVWRKDRTPAGTFFWFFPCNRIDAMDKERSGHQYDERLRRWKFVDGQKYAANLDAIGTRHVWHDSAVAFHFPFCSQGFKDAMDKAGVRGIGYREINAF